MRLYVNSRLVSSTPLHASAAAKLVTKQAIGANLNGENSASFQCSEFVLADMSFTQELRSDLAKYFWLKWHG
jgi:hypothetical protein